MASASELRRALVEHRAPEWFEDAKLGIFIHWGIFAVPAWAPPGTTLPELLREHFWDLQSFSPYCEWYPNALRIENSPTWRHHGEHYGDAPYESFREPFEERGLTGFDPDAWADLFARAGARYVVLVTKHHDGYCLWPTQVRNPHNPGWHAPRDVVGELAAAVRARGMRFGVYYSGGLDWTFEPGPIRGLVDVLACVPQDADYRAYADAQVRELVERVEPSVLWNDIAWPAGDSLWRLLGDYLEAVPDGAINDRFLPVAPWLSRALRLGPVQRLAGSLLKRAVARPDHSFAPPRTPHADFRTPEYASYPEAKRYKWEACRGIGKSFGWNRAEREEDRVAPEVLVREFTDMVAKNGNLLLNVGPDDRGGIPAEQASRLEALGDWLRANGEAIYGTRPWRRAEGQTRCGVPLRFTARDGCLYALLLESPQGDEVVLAGVPSGSKVELLGHGALAASRDGDSLRVSWPRGLPTAPAYALRVGPEAS